MLKREQVAPLYLSSWCLVTVSVLWIFIEVPCVGRRCVVVVFPDHTHLLLCKGLTLKDLLCDVGNHFMWYQLPFQLFIKISVGICSQQNNKKPPALNHLLCTIWIHVTSGWDLIVIAVDSKLDDTYSLQTSFDILRHRCVRQLDAHFTAF